MAPSRVQTGTLNAEQQELLEQWLAKLGNQRGVAATLGISVRSLSRLLADIRKGIGVSEYRLRDLVAACGGTWESVEAKSQALDAGDLGFQPILPPCDPFDVILWGHGDGVGGVELAYQIANAFLRHRPSVRICIISPVPDYISTFYPASASNITVIPAGPLLTLERNSQGEIDRDETRAKFEERFVARDLEQTVATLSEWIRPLIPPHRNCLLVSTGEPLAIAVADRNDIPSVVVTDHLTSITVGSVMHPFIHTDDAIRRAFSLISGMHNDCEEMWFPRLEFVSPGHAGHFALESSPVEMHGLFYEPPSGKQMAQNEACAVLKEEVAHQDGPEAPLVCVFYGAGQAWSKAIESLLFDCQRTANHEFYLLLPELPKSGSSGKREWLLYRPRTGSKPQRVPDPGSLIAFCAMADLVVGRGGLVAQQVFACAFPGAHPKLPVMAFVNESRHPQIRNQYRCLTDHDLVYPIELSSLEKNGIKTLSEALQWREATLQRGYRERVRLRYGGSVLADLTRHLLQQHL